MRHSFSCCMKSQALATSYLVLCRLSAIWKSAFGAAMALLVGFATSSTNSILISPVSHSEISETDDVKNVGEYRKALKAFLKRTKSKDDAALFNATIDMCLLHDQLVNDPRYEVNRQLQGFRAVASARLKKCKKEVELRLLRYRRANGKNGERFNEGQRLGLELAQSEATEVSFESESYWAILASDMQAIASISGGPINLWSYTGNPAGPLCDYGPDLVNLIENTISPDSWRRNGGNGIIEYYQPLRIIVVGCSSQVHNEITDLLRTLRR